MTDVEYVPVHMPHAQPIRTRPSVTTARGRLREGRRYMHTGDMLSEAHSRSRGGGAILTPVSIVQCSSGVGNL